MPWDHCRLRMENVKEAMRTSGLWRSRRASQPRGTSFADDIPFIGCINLLEREDRYRMMSEQFERMGILHKIHWHRPHRHPSGGRVGCFESHLEVFKAALEAEVPFAVVVEDDVKFVQPGTSERTFQKLIDLMECGIEWHYASLQNSGSELRLWRDGDEDLPPGVFRGAFYFTRCYAISKEAMRAAVARGISEAHVDVSLAVSNWGMSFVVRPAAALDVPSESDNDWSEGGWGPYLAGQMQGYTHFPCLVTDRYKTMILPLYKSQDEREAIAWSKFMDEPGAREHLGNVVPRRTVMKMSKSRGSCFAGLCPSSSWHALSLEPTTV